MFCEKCGASIADGGRFCGNCGGSPDKDDTTAGTMANTARDCRYVPDTGIRQMFFSLNGRLNRWRYCKRLFVLGLATGLLSIVLGLLAANLLSLWPQYCLMVRRLHDLNRDNKLAVALIAVSLVFEISNLTGNGELVSVLVPLGGIFGLAVSLYLLFAKGTAGPNDYGPDPLE